MKRTFIYTDDKSNKFWIIEITGNSYTVNYGKVGSAGQTQTKDFADELTCAHAAAKLIVEKMKKGYVEQEGEVPVSEPTAPKQAKTASAKAKPAANKKWHKADFWNGGYAEEAFDDLTVNFTIEKTEAEQAAEDEILNVYELSRNLVNACYYDGIDKVKRLIEEQGADVNTPWHNDYPLTKAANNWAGDDGAVELVKYLIRKGADVNKGVSKDKIKNQLVLRCIEAYREKPDINKLDEIFDSVTARLWNAAVHPVLVLVRETVEQAAAEGRTYWGFYFYKQLKEEGGFVVSSMDLDDKKLARVVTDEQLKQFNYRVAYKEMVHRLEKGIQELKDEGIFEPISKGEFSLVMRDDWPRVGNTQEHTFFTIRDEEKLKQARVQYEKDLAEFKNETNCGKLADLAEIMFFGHGIVEGDQKKAVEFVGKSLFSLDGAESELAAEILTYLSRNGDVYGECAYYEGIYNAANLDFKEAKRDLELAAKHGVAKAEEEYNKLIAKLDGGKTQKEEAKFTDSDLFARNEYFTARAESVQGLVRLQFHDESEAAYSAALDYLNNLMGKGYSRHFDGYDLMVQFVEKPVFLPVKRFLPKVPVNAFFTKAVTYPALHDKIRTYVANTLVMYDWQPVFDGEDATPAGSCAAVALALADRKHLDMLVLYAENSDNEHQSVQTRLIPEVIARYGLAADTIPVIYELAVSYGQDYRVDIPAALYTDPANLEILYNYFNNMPWSRFRDNHIFRFIEIMLPQATRTNLQTIKPHALVAKGNDAKVYYDFYNYYKNLAGEIENEDYGPDLVPEGVTNNFTIIKETIPVVISEKDLEKRGLQNVRIETADMDGGKFFALYHPLAITDPAVKKHIQSQWNKCSELSMDGQIIYGERVIKLDDYYIDVSAMPCQHALVLYDGAKKPQVLYGMLDYVSLIKGFGSKPFTTDAAREKMQQAATVMEAPDTPGLVKEETEAERIMQKFFYAWYDENYYRARRFAEMIKPSDGDYYITADMYMVDLLNKAYETAEARKLCLELAELCPQHKAYWEKEAG